VEQELSARQGKRQIAEFIEHNKVQPAELFSYSPLAACTCLGLKFVDQIDDVEEPAAFAVTDTGAGDRNGEMRLAGTGRSSVIMPGVWDRKCGSCIRIIHDAARRWWCWAASGTRVQATLLFASLTGRCLCSRVG
jgi:hypothetical protein